MLEDDSSTSRAQDVVYGGIRSIYPLLNQANCHVTESYIGFGAAGVGGSMDTRLGMEDYTERMGMIGYPGLSLW